MVLLTILALTLLILLTAVILSICILGSGVLIVFGDVIVCVIVIGWIIKKLFFKKRES